MKAKPFNLLKPMIPPLTVWDRIYNWVTTQARIVIFIVIILVTVAFVGKVVVDTEAKNKKKELDNLFQQLSFYATASEPDVRRIVRRADVYSDINSKHTSFTFLIEEVYQILGNSSSELTIE